MKQHKYIPPVFHMEQANDEQIKLLQTVFETLINSNIRFCVVLQNNKRQDELNIKSYGFFSYDEKAEILKEVVSMYYDGNEINHITME